MKPLDFNCERKPNVLLPQIPLHTVLDSSNWSLVHFQQPRVYIKQLNFSSTVEDALF